MTKIKIEIAGIEFPTADLPRHYNFTITARIRRPRAAAYRPFLLGKSDFLIGGGSADGIESGNQIGETIDEVTATGNRRFVNIHGIRVFYTGEARGL